MMIMAAKSTFSLYHASNCVVTGNLSHFLFYKNRSASGIEESDDYDDDAFQKMLWCVHETYLGNIVFLNGMVCAAVLWCALCSSANTVQINDNHWLTSKYSNYV